MVEVAARGELDGLEVELGRRSTNDECQVIRRTGRGADGLDVVLDELEQRRLVEQRLGLLVEVGLVGRTSALGDEQELVGIALLSVQLNLRW